MTDGWQKIDRIARRLKRYAGYWPSDEEVVRAIRSVPCHYTGIARDTSVNGGLVNPGTSLTWSHTCTGSNLILFASAFGDFSDVITGATYAGVSMTLVGKVKGGNDRWCYLFVLVGPSSGANNVVVSASSSVAIDGQSASYTGALQSGQPDSSNTKGQNTTSFTISTTVVASNCWLIGAFRDGSATAGAGANQLQGSNGLFTADSNGTVPTGSQSMTYTNGSGADFGGVLASFAPAAGGGGTPSHLLSSLGVGA